MCADDQFATVYQSRVVLIFELCVYEMAHMDLTSCEFD